MMLFGLFNVTISFPIYFHNILAKKLNVFLIIYLDNMFVYTNKADHVDVV